jgi:hypothetical protein
VFNLDEPIQTEPTKIDSGLNYLFSYMYPNLKKVNSKKKENDENTVSIS